MVKLLFQNVDGMVNNRLFRSDIRVTSSFFIAQRANLVRNGLKPMAKKMIEADKRYLLRGRPIPQRPRVAHSVSTG